jgi:hypothetical protein
MNLDETLVLTLSEPYPEKLWQLRSDLLEMEIGIDHPSLKVLDYFYLFLNELIATSTAREYSHFASILDMAAVAGIAIQNLMEDRESEGWMNRFLLGAISEGMMVMAARQYVKAWEEEMEAAFSAAAWSLSDSFCEERRTLVDTLVAPIRSEELNAPSMAALIVRYHQLLLLAWLVPWLSEEANKPKDDSEYF